MRKITVEIDGQINDVNLVEKTFKTGSRGFHGMGKIKINDKKYQCNFLIIEIGSKPKKEKEEL